MRWIILNDQYSFHYYTSQPQESVFGSFGELWRPADNTTSQMPMSIDLLASVGYNVWVMGSADFGCPGVDT
jgi:hypothetical protein